MITPNILLLSHGRMAEGMVKAIQMFSGKTEHITALCLTESLSADNFRQQLSIRIDSLSEAKQLLIFADLQGGSPFTTALELLAEKELLPKSFVIAGMNLPIVLSAALHEGLYAPDEIRQLIEEARSSIALFEVRDEEETL